MTQVENIGLPIPDFEFILINRDSVITNTVTGNILKPYVNKYGYNCITIRKPGIIKTYGLRIARVKAGLFIPNPDNKTQVNHINGIRTDDRIENLEWVTPSENIQHAFDKLGRGVWNTGKGNEKLHKPVLCFSIEGTFIKRYESVKSAALEMSVSSTLISAVCRNESKTSCGYKWKYEKDFTAEKAMDVGDGADQPVKIKELETSS